MGQELGKRAPITVVMRNGSVLTATPLARGAEGALRDFNRSLSRSTRAKFLPHLYDRTTVEEVVRRSESGVDRTYVLWDESKVVGYFFLSNFDRSVPSLGIGIADEYQGHGLGRQLMEILINDARSAGKTGIELRTLPRNRPALQLYLSLGFVHVRWVQRAARGGRLVRERSMFLPLQEGAEAPSSI